MKKKPAKTKTKKIYVKASPPAKKPAPQGPGVSVYIVGESPMVEEFASLCSAHGYSVALSWNQPPAGSPKELAGSARLTPNVPAGTSLAIELTNTDAALKRANILKLDQALPPTAPILSSSVTVSATEQCSWISGKHRLVGISALPTFIGKPLVETAPSVFTPKETLEPVQRFFRSLGKEIEIVQDRVGMVLPGILCQMINEAVFAVTEDIADPRDIDAAVKLGIDCPFGPIEWAEKIGINQVYAVLSAIHNDVQEERTRIAPLLKQMALSSDWWKT